MMSRSDEQHGAHLTGADPAAAASESSEDPAVPTAILQRYVAIGDSFTEGVGDPDPDGSQRPARLGRPGRRGAGDRDRGSATPTSRSAARKLHAIIAEQLEPAVALEPDLVTIYAGANDILRPRVDLDALVADYDTAWAASPPAPGSWCGRPSTRAGSAIYRPVRGRLALYNEVVRESADRTAPRASTSAAAGVPRLALTGTRTGCTWGRPATSAWPSRCSTASACRTTWRRCRWRPARLEPPRPAPREPRLGPRLRAALGAPPRDRPFLGRHRISRATRHWRDSPYRSRPDPCHRAATDELACAPTGRRSCGCSSVGRARPSQGRCREFESRHPLHGSSPGRSPPSPPSPLAALGSCR